MTQAKENAALAALEYVETGMTLGLGSGSTAEIFLKHLGEQIKTGMEIRGIPTSARTAKVAKSHGITLVEPDKVSKIHLTIDGADEVDPNFALIKGGGACLLREKIIAHASDRMIVIVDPAKMVKTLGAFALPVEVDPFAMALTAEKIYQALYDTGCKAQKTSLRQRKDGKGPLVTDGGHYIIDCACEVIPSANETAHELASIPGVVEHGLFIGLSNTIIVGETDHAKVIELKG